MSKELVEKVVELQDRIDELNDFLFLASEGGFWEKALYEKKLTFFTNVIGFGFGNKNTKIRLDKNLTLKVLEVFKEERDRLQAELNTVLRGVMEDE